MEWYNYINCIFIVHNSLYSVLVLDACFTDIQFCPTGSIYLTMYLILKFVYDPIFFSHIYVILTFCNSIHVNVDLTR